ncbi:MAG: DUF6364 family protein [Candidatus Methylomirabilis sp.]|nr:DUF6364 family protein [Candidatus Methylomirabilis sp.]
MGHNITLRLDKELIRKAKVLAAQQGTSVSGLLARRLEQAHQRRGGIRNRQAACA